MTDISKPHPFFNNKTLQSILSIKGRTWLTVFGLLAFFALMGAMADLRHFDVREAPDSRFKAYVVFKGDGTISRCEANDLYQNSFTCHTAGAF